MADLRLLLAVHLYPLCILLCLGRLSAYGVRPSFLCPGGIYRCMIAFTHSYPCIIKPRRLLLSSSAIRYQPDGGGDGGRATIVEIALHLGSAMQCASAPEPRIVSFCLHFYASRTFDVRRGPIDTSACMADGEPLHRPLPCQVVPNDTLTSMQESGPVRLRPLPHTALQVAGSIGSFRATGQILEGRYSAARSITENILTNGEEVNEVPG